MVLPPAARARRGKDGGTRRLAGAAGFVRQDMGRGCADRHGGLSPGLLAPARARFPADFSGRRHFSARRLGWNPGVLGGDHLPGVASGRANRSALLLGFVAARAAAHRVPARQEPGLPLYPDDRRRGFRGRSVGGYSARRRRFSLPRAALWTLGSAGSVRGPSGGRRFLLGPRQPEPKDSGWESGDGGFGTPDG